MEPMKACNLCGTDSNDTAIFSCAYAKGDLQICLECLTEGILEITKSMKGPKPNMKKNTIDFEMEKLPLESFDLNVPEEVFGFNCQNCGSVLFSNTFPIVCDCGHENNTTVLKDLMNKK